MSSKASSGARSRVGARSRASAGFRSTTSWTRLRAERRQIDSRVEGLSRKGEETFRLRRAPAPIGAVQPELLLDVGARQWLVPTAAQVPLALLQRAPVLQPRAHVTGDFVRIRI